jgi:hypothetical protein
MELVPSLFHCCLCSPFGLVTKRHVAKSASQDHEGEYQEYERWHIDILCWCIPDTLLAHNDERAFRCLRPPLKGERKGTQAREQTRHPRNHDLLTEMCSERHFIRGTWLEECDSYEDL